MNGKTAKKLRKLAKNRKMYRILKKSWNDLTVEEKTKLRKL